VAASCWVATHASTAPPLNASTSSEVGELQSVSPWSATAASVMYARTDGIMTSSASLTETCRRGTSAPNAATASGIPEAATPGGASAAGAAPTSSLSLAISAVGSSCSSPSRSIASTALASASKHSSRTSITRRSSSPVRPRRVSNTSSIVWVSAAMRANPIVALMPFSEWAMRKISSIVSPSSGASSMRITARFRLCRCSRLSARNMPRYSEVSISVSGR
jgi:hypothetical protein